MALTDFPIEFPDYKEVNASYAARFRALTPVGQVAEPDEMFRLYRCLRTTSGRPEEVDRLAEAEEQHCRLAILEFAIRHG